MDARHVKAQEIVAGGKITRGNGYYLVPSQSGAARHKVVLDGLFPSCTCADFELTERACKHLIAVKLWVEQQKGESQAVTKADAPKPVPEPAPPLKRPTYKQDWPNYNKAQTREKDHVRHLLADLCAGLPGPVSQKGTKGGQWSVSVRDAVFSIVYKVYCGTSARRFMCDLRDAHERGDVGAALCHNSVLKAMESESLTPILKDLVGQTALPLAGVETKFAVDSSGFCTSRFVRYFDVKYGVTRQQAEWIKVHIATGVLTNVVTAVEILDMHAADSPQLPALVNATAEGFAIKEVSADKAYTCTENLETVARHGGTLYSPFKSNATGGIGGIFAKAFHYFQFNRDDFLKHYHARSNVESTFSGIKRLTGDSVRSKKDVSMRNEVYCKLIAWNLVCLVHAIYELGVVPVFWQDAAGMPPDVLRFPVCG